MTSKNNQELLQAVFEFMAEDLAANRGGELSERQRVLLQKHLRKETLRIVLILISLGIVPFAGVVVFGLDRNLSLVGLSVFGMIGLPLTGYALFGERRHLWQFDLQHHAATSVYGIARQSTTIEEEGNRRNRHNIMIGDIVFQITREQFLALEEGKDYLVYYTPRAKLILSIEAWHDADR